LTQVLSRKILNWLKNWKLKKALVAIETDDTDNTDKSYISIKNKIEEINVSLFTDEYNVARYLDAFKVKPLLVCFNLDVRNDILLYKIKDKQTKVITKDRIIFTSVQLVSYPKWWPRFHDLTYGR
jgi:hypothetical protein